MAFKLEHLHVKTPDPQGTARFYLEALGATLIEATHENTHFRLNLHGLTLNISNHIEHQVREQRYGLEHFAIQTDQWDATVAKLSAEGARVLEEVVSPVAGHGGPRVCFMEGPQGVQFELIEVKRLA